MTEGVVALDVGCPTEQAIVQSLFYFEIFSYPLTAKEVFEFSNTPGVTQAEVLKSLQHLVEQGLVFQFGLFFQTKNDPSWVPHRLECNARADKMLPIAQRVARFIGAFPFVRGVFVSGSLSKHSMKHDSDIDFFIVTAPRRLWLSRSLLIFFKKVFLFNSHKYFCVNYFIDSEHLEIEEKNLFAATEIVTLLPMYGRETVEQFFQKNDWTRKFFPHFPLRPNEMMPAGQSGFLKNAVEWLLGGKVGEWLDVRAMQMTVKYWRRKFSHFDDDTFDVALKSRRYVSKHHPLYFQQSVLQAFTRRVADFFEVK